jgi:ubiquinone biosynthesis protein UbiJ
MKFRMLLWALGLMMKKASKNNPEFQKQLVGKDFTFQLQTQGGELARHFIVKDERIKSKGGSAKDPAFSISFKDAATGMYIMTAKDKNAFMKGIQEKDIKIDGDLSLVMWFQSIVKHVKPKSKKTK